MSENLTGSIPGLPDNSILYISATIHPDHPMHSIFRKHVDPKPDIDLGRLVESSGSWIRRYFVEKVIDGTCEPLPPDLSKYRGVVIGCSMHYMSPERGEVAPWQRKMMDLIRRAVFDYQLPFLGLCGGGQIGFAALGGRVGPNPKGVGMDPEREGSLVLRTTTIDLTEEGRSDPIFRGCPPSFGMQAIHSDYLTEYPDGFCVLANSADIPNQALAFGDNVRLFGIHPEMSADFVHTMHEVVINNGVFRSEKNLGPHPKKILFDAARKFVATPEANARVVRNFLTEFCAKHEPSMVPMK